MATLSIEHYFKAYKIIFNFFIELKPLAIEMHAISKPLGSPPHYTPSQPQARQSSHIGHENSVNVSFKRFGVIANGEGRSANRSKWTSATETAVLDNQPQSGDNLDQPTDLIKIDAPSLVWESAEAIRPQFAAIDALVHSNISRVQSAFQAARVGPHHFAGSTGYGHGDLGREALDEVMAGIMGAETAAVRIQYVSGTHAIASALYGCLRPGDELLAVAGSPYDTLEEVIGIRGTPGAGSLSEFGVSYRKLDLDCTGAIDWNALATAIRPGEKTNVVYYIVKSILD